MRTWVLIAVTVLLSQAVAAQEFKNVDPEELKVFVSASEFIGAKPTISKRRPEFGSVAPGSSTALGLDELELRAAGYVHGILHQYHTRSMRWSQVDLGNLVQQIFKRSSRPIVIDAPQRYVRGGVYGDHSRFTYVDGSNEIKCVTYDLVVNASNRIIGFVCFPHGVEMTQEDALRHIRSVGIRGVLEPG